MPRVEGVAAIKELGSRAPSCRVLVLTSFSDQARVSDALRAGADGYLLKYAEPEDIIDGIRQVVRGGSPLDPAVARILLNTSRRRAGAVDMLTAREREILILLEGGLNNRQIGSKLDIAERTVGLTCKTSFSGWAGRDLPHRGAVVGTAQSSIEVSGRMRSSYGLRARWSVRNCARPALRLYEHS